MGQNTSSSLEQTNMASREERMEITQAEYDAIFGSSDAELQSDLGQGSDLDFDGLDD